MNLDPFFQNVLSDTEVKVMELLHENIRQQAFFGKPWPRAKNPAKSGKKLLYQSGDLQDGYMSRIQGMNIHITNSVAYAGVHNEGAEISVTAQMKKYFWAMYYKAAGAVSKSYDLGGGKRHLIVSSDSKKRMQKQAASTSKRAIKMNAEASYWKSLALMKIGEKIIIPERRVMGDHPELDNAIEKICDWNMEKTINQMMNENMKP